METTKPEFKIKIAGDALLDGKVSLTLFSKTLTAIQQAFLSLGKARVEVSPSKRGRTPGKLEEELQLYLVKTEPGSINATIELPKRQVDLFPDRNDINKELVDQFRRVVTHLGERNYQELEKEIPDPRYRNRIIATLNEIAPTPAQSYRLSVAFSGSKKNLPLEKITRIENPEFFAAADLEDYETSKLSDSIIQATCRATISSEGKPKVKEVLDFQIDRSAEQFMRLRNFVYGPYIFILKRDLDLIIRQEDGFYLIDCESLDIHAVGTSRNGAIQEFKEQFSYLWFEYALEKDHNLLSHALELKRHIKRITKSVEKIDRAKIQ